MNSIEALLAKKKEVKEVKEVKEPVQKKKLNFAGLNLKKAEAMQAEANQQPKEEEKQESSASSEDPFLSLKNELSFSKDKTFDESLIEVALDKALSETDIPETEASQASQFKNPTMEDIEKFVFEEQPELTQQETMDEFSTMLDELQNSTKDTVPQNLARNLKFIKEHSFLAEILKPESISVLVSAMRKSYGHIVSTKTVKTAKKAETNKKVSSALDSLGDFSF